MSSKFHDFYSVFKSAFAIKEPKVALRRLSSEYWQNWVEVSQVNSNNFLKLFHHNLNTIQICISKKKSTKKKNEKFVSELTCGKYKTCQTTGPHASNLLVFNDVWWRINCWLFRYCVFTYFGYRGSKKNKNFQ